MAVSSDRDHFFQTTSSIADNERRQRKANNTLGSPIRLPTKLLAVEVNKAFDESGDVVFVAEAGGTVSAVRLSTNQVSRTGRGSTAPLSCLTHHATHYVHDPFRQLDIFAGGWDKSITKYTFRYSAEAPGGRTVTGQETFKAHLDFVKCVLVTQTADQKPILISGGADGEVNFWSLVPPNSEATTDTATNHPSSTISSTTGTAPNPPTRLATLRPNARAIECLAIDPYSDPKSPTLFLSTSQREIFSCTIPNLSDLTSNIIQSTLSPPSLVHSTSVYKIHFDNQGDLWTASADKTSLHLVRDTGWNVDLTLPHPDFVRDITTHPHLPYAITACRDEEIRIWNSNTGALYHVYSGHYDEVTGLAISNHTLISVSIDATLRRWSLVPEELAVEKQKMVSGRLISEDIDDGEPTLSKSEEKEMSMLTEEEEAELRALMEED